MNEEAEQVGHTVMTQIPTSRKMGICREIARFGPLALALLCLTAFVSLISLRHDLLGKGALRIYFCSPILFIVGLKIARIWGRVETDRRETTFTGIALFGSLLGYLVLSIVACLIVVFMVFLGFAGIGPP